MGEGSVFGKWWGTFQTQSDQIEPPSMDLFPDFWFGIAPPLTVIDETSENYWESVRAFLCEFLGNDSIPDPTANFKEFTFFVQDSKSLLVPSSIEDVIAQISKIPQLLDGHTLIWRYSMALDDTILVTKALHRIFTYYKLAPLGQSIADHLGTVDLLFDHYFELVDIWFLEFNQVAVIRLGLVEMLSAMLMKYPDAFGSYRDRYRAFVYKLLRIIQRPDPEMQIATFRILVSLFEKTYKRLTPFDQADLLMRIVKATPRNNPLHFAAIRFAMNLSPSQFGFISLLKITTEDFHDQIDLDVIERVLRQPTIKEPIDIIKYVCRIALTNGIFTNAAIASLRKPFMKYCSLESVLAFVPLLIRRVIQFYHFSSIQNKFSSRKLRCVRLLRMLKEVPGYAPLISNGISTLQQGAYDYPELFELIDPNPGVDQLLSDEINGLNIAEVDLKGFFNEFTQEIPKVKAPEPYSSAPSSGRRISAKESVAAVKARYLEALQNKKSIDAKTLLVDDTPASSR